MYRFKRGFSRKRSGLNKSGSGKMDGLRWTKGVVIPTGVCSRESIICQFGLGED